MKGVLFVRSSGRLSNAVGNYFAGLDKPILLLSLLLASFGFIAIGTATAANALHDRYVTVHVVGIFIGLVTVFAKRKFRMISAGTSTETLRNSSFSPRLMAKIRWSGTFLRGSAYS